MSWPLTVSVFANADTPMVTTRTVVEPAGLRPGPCGPGGLWHRREPTAHQEKGSSGDLPVSRTYRASGHMSMSDPHSTAHGNQVGEVDLSFGAVIAGRRSAHGAPPPLAHILTPAPRHQGRCYFPVYSAERAT